MAVDDQTRRRPRYTVDFVASGPALSIEDIRRELYRIAEYLREPVLDAVQFTVLTEPVPRPREGMVAFFAAGVVGGNSGLKQFKGGSWTPI